MWHRTRQTPPCELRTRGEKERGGVRAPEAETHEAASSRTPLVSSVGPGARGQDTQGRKAATSGGQPPISRRLASGARTPRVHRLRPPQPLCPQTPPASPPPPEPGPRARWTTPARRPLTALLCRSPLGASSSSPLAPSAVLLVSSLLGNPFSPPASPLRPFSRSQQSSQKNCPVLSLRALTSCESGFHRL